MEEETSIRANGSDLTPIHKSNPTPVSEEVGKFLNLDHAMTAPQLPPLRPGLTSPTSPISSPLSPRRADFLWRKDKGKEEKKMAEKEREKVEKHKRKELENKSKELYPTESTSHILASENPQSSITDDHKLGETKENSPVSLGGLDRFKRTSKSLKFGSLGRKDKPVVVDDDEAPHVPDKEKKNRFNIRKKSFGILS